MNELIAREHAISTGWLIEYDGAIIRGAHGSTKGAPRPWKTREGAQRALDRSPITKARGGRVIEVALVQIGE